VNTPFEQPLPEVDLEKRIFKNAFKKNVSKEKLKTGYQLRLPEE
jgi:hypothetical protein